MIPTNKILTDGDIIYWKNVRELISFLSLQEEEFLKTETKLRDKREKFTYKTDTEEQQYLKFEATPTFARELEKFINPFKSNWQQRYYKALFKIDICDEKCKEICMSYLQGLEWTMKYYTHDCPDWRWHYPYNYPPLLVDLIKYIPYNETNYFNTKINSINPVSQLVQLSYVLPRQSLSFLPEKLYKRLKDEKEHLYPHSCSFTWVYCKYFWESHVDFPPINIQELETFVNNVMD